MTTMAREIKAHGYGPRQDFAVEKVLWRRSPDPRTYGPRQYSQPVLRDLTCVICGLDCDSPYTHHESWRDDGHRPLVVEELDATPNPRRLASSSPGLRGASGARR